MTEFRTETGADGVAVIVWDVPGRSMNVMTLEGIEDLARAIDAALADPAVRGIVITSAKADFAGGMDLAALARMRGDGPADAAAQRVFDGLMRLHGLLRRIEAGTAPQQRGAAAPGIKPVACALPGTAAGIGLELALACHRIFAADREDARIGLPEIRVGIFPGAGGTTRLVRKLGLLAAAPFLFEGRMKGPRAMQQAGILDEVVPPETLLDAARAWVRTATPADLAKPWHRIPGGGPWDRKGFEVFVGAAAMIGGRTRGAYPAAQAMLSAIYEGAQVDFDTALRIEARWFTHTLLQPSAAAMMRTLFLDRQALEKGARRPPMGAPGAVGRLGVIGAGAMGGGIAQAAALAGIDVVLIDRDLATAKAGHAALARNLGRAVSRGRLTADRRDAALARLRAAAGPADLAGCDLIIEAVAEDRAVKATVLAAAALHARPGAILATNTSSLTLAELAPAMGDRTADFVGLHFFSPVDRMRLVEIIRGPDTGDRALAVAFDLVRQLDKTPILVRDARLFYANRCILAYADQGLRMLNEGVPPALVENAARSAGMPVGPLQLLDETSIELAARVAGATMAGAEDAAAAQPDRGGSPALAVIRSMLLAGRTGRKGGAGFYDYDPQGRRLQLWPGLGDLGARAPTRPKAEALCERLLMAQALEAVRALEAGIIDTAREGDVGAVLGWGFAPWTGGPFGWIDMQGAAATCDRAHALAALHGAPFTPPAMLEGMARSGGRFRVDPCPDETAV